MVCDSNANINSALRESLGDDAKTGTSDNLVTDDSNGIQSRIAGSTKRVLYTPIDFDESGKFNESVLESLKTKYIVLTTDTDADTCGSPKHNGRREDSYTPPPTGASNGNFTSNGFVNGNTHNQNGSVSGSIEDSFGNHTGVKEPTTNNFKDTTANKSSGFSLVETTNHNNKTHFLSKNDIGYNGVSNCIIYNGNSKTNGTTNKNISTKPRSATETQLPAPKRILFPRENIRIGWKGTGRKWNVGAGMLNVGNTCYLNSTLQALFHVPSLANWLLSDVHNSERCESVDTSCIICAMTKTLEASQSNNNSIRPYHIFSKLKTICKSLLLGRQEDAHEFLRYLVEAMEKSFLSRFRFAKELDQRSKETTPLNQILGGYLRSTVCCLSCNHVSVTFQHFQDLMLDIRKSETIEDALEGYFARERLEEMGYKCEACKKKVSATKQFTLERPPVVLCIQLKRFSGLGNKLSKHITIKPRIDLTRFVYRKTPGEYLSYKLVSMITHLGTSQHCGHYTAIGLTESGAYYNFDDSYVRSVSLQNVCNTNAYVIFYEIENTQHQPQKGNCTQTSHSNIKENHSFSNGLKASTAISHDKGSTTPPLIGPHLPTTSSESCQSHSTNSNGITSKLSINRQSGIPTGTNFNSNKTKILFKNEINGNGNCIYPSSTTTSNTAMTLSLNGYSSTNGTGAKKNVCNESNKFPRSNNSGQTSHPKLGKETNVNGNESPRFSPEVEVSSTSSPERQKSSSLPSMPHLLDDTSINNCKRKMFNDDKKFKSLVPYEMESDDEDGIPSEAKRTKHSEFGGAKEKIHQNEVSPRLPDEGSKIGSLLKKKATNSNMINGSLNMTQSKDKKKTDTIEGIFNTNQKLQHNSSSTSFQHTPARAISQSTQQQQYNTSFTLNSDDKSNAKLHIKENGKRNSPTRPAETADACSQIKRSLSTPPTSAVVKTKTGFWKVLNLQPRGVNSPDSTSESETPPTAPKNLKNPFSSKSSESQTTLKKSKYTGDLEKRNKIFNGNGYQNDDNANDSVSELLKQTHRGYGVPTLTWNGEKPDIEKEIKADASEQLKREWEEEQENEMDRGRQKKVRKKISYENTETPGYNPFEEHENQRNWSPRGGLHQRYYRGNFRNNFNRNRFKFQRYNRFQRHHHNGNSNFNRNNNDFHSRNRQHYIKRNNT